MLRPRASISSPFCHPHTLPFAARPSSFARELTISYHAPHHCPDSPQRSSEFGPATRAHSSSHSNGTRVATHNGLLPSLSGLHRSAHLSASSLRGYPYTAFPPQRGAVQPRALGLALALTPRDIHARTGGDVGGSARACVHACDGSSGLPSSPKGMSRLVGVM
ncbi:hypothetical protein BC826DRAFT_994196 [Russula brevipes]|nr:hypothetical protein BC826DRAFT_994196 [Russula brevipes]